MYLCILTFIAICQFSFAPVQCIGVYLSQEPWAARIAVHLHVMHSAYNSVIMLRDEDMAIGSLIWFVIVSSTLVVNKFVKSKEKRTVELLHRKFV